MKHTLFALSSVAIVCVAAAANAQPPVKPADTPRSDSSRSVTLSLTEYNRLIDLANRSTPPAPIAPVDAVLASADMRVRVDRDTAQGVFNLAGDVLRPGIKRVKLVSGATILGASVDGRALPLTTDGGAQVALLPGPGPFAVSLEWGAPLTFAPGRASFTLPVPPAGTVHATIDLPGEQADVHLSAGVVTRRAASGGRTVVDVTLRPGTMAEVSWSMRDSAPVAAAREVRMLVDTFTLVTIGDADVRMAALVDLTVVQGEPRTIDVRLPGGYELSGVSGPGIETGEPRDGGLTLTVNDPTVRRHQFLMTLERAHAGGSFRMDTDVIALPDVQRERGEIAVEGVGTLELAAAERPGMHRIDVRELNPALQSLARLPVLSAFRYQRTPSSQIALSMDVQRFADAGVLAAVADRAVATTLISSEGRALTEVVLHVRNRAQAFLKVTLPTGATIVSVEVAGESAKPVVGADGTRVPLLRPGFRPNGVYTVSYVYLHAGTPFARKGELQMTLPKMDIPVGLVEWEMFVPDRYVAEAVDGNVIDRRFMVAAVSTDASLATSGRGYGTGGVMVSIAPGALPGQIRGQVRDASGSALPGTTIALDVERSHKAAIAAGDGTFLISGVPAGQATISAQLNGFVTQRQTFTFDQQGRQIEFVLPVAAMSESTTITASGSATPPPPPAASLLPKSEPSQNVLNLQRRTAGVLPIRIDVPRAGTSHQFVKPLVVDQEARVVMKYKQK
ncbi:MAG TPA: carboxypeptidase regulatory-like domain-containing protein [Vicinamibacterales bacterium]